MLVCLERLTRAFPFLKVLVERHGLTCREAEVALHLAQGSADGEIAKHLGASSHTVRYHAEWVFTKLRIHSRKALALKLMTDHHQPTAPGQLCGQWIVFRPGVAVPQTVPVGDCE